MKFTTAVALALEATSVLALPQPIDLGDGVTLTPRNPTMQKRRATRKSRTLIPSDKRIEEIEGASNKSDVSYSSNWAGAVLIGSGYKTVKGTFTVPTPSKPSGGSSSTTYSASAWVGIDGDTCQTAILQTGIDFNVQGSSVSYDAWYEWYPDYAYDFSGFSISAGDSISLTVTATSTSAGSVTIENNTKGKTVTHSFSGESAKLCETNAEWIVEDFEENSGLVPFADFGTVTFTSISPSASGATIFDIEQNSKVLTSCSSSSSSVTCSYV